MEPNNWHIITKNGQEVMRIRELPSPEQRMLEVFPELLRAYPEHSKQLQERVSDHKGLFDLCVEIANSTPPRQPQGVLKTVVNGKWLDVREVTYGLYILRAYAKIVEPENDTSLALAGIRCLLQLKPKVQP